VQHFSCTLNEEFNMLNMTSAAPPWLTMHSTGRAPDEDFRDRPALPLLRVATGAAHDFGASPAPAVLTATAQPHLSISVEDWDALFRAVEIRLREAVGEHLGTLPDTPHHSAEVSASLVQAVVLDCVTALEQLHAALKTERGERTGTA